MTATSAAVGASHAGGLHVERLGDGAPVTLFAHGLGGCGAELRALAGPVAGTRVLVDLPGHGDTPLAADRWEYADLAAALDAAARDTGATRAVGVSVSAGALLTTLAERGDRWERVALLLPAALDQPRAGQSTRRLADLGDAIDSGDLEAVVAHLLAGLPAAVREGRAARMHSRATAQRLLRRPAPRPVEGTTPVAHRRELPRLGSAALVVAEREDPLHPVQTAREVADALGARLVVLDPGSIFWTARAQVAELLAGFLAGTG